jgi:hypothetical protein
MERRKRPYSMQKRPAAKHRHIHDAKFRDETGVYTTAISTGCMRGDDARSMHLADSLIETVCEIRIA